MHESRIKVNTIGYFHRDAEMRVTLDQLPKALNSNRRFFENGYNSRVPSVNLDVPVKDAGGGEEHNESLLDYIRQKGYPEGERPAVVTNRKLLKLIASQVHDIVFNKSRQSHKIVAHRHDNVIFLAQLGTRVDINTNFGAVFEHWLTKQSYYEPVPEDGTVRKAVFTAQIPLGSSQNICTVMYSGEIDAVHDDRHVEMKLCSRGFTWYFAKNTSCSVYWQCLLSNTDDLIIGSRTGKYEDRGRRPYTLYAIEKLSRRDFYEIMVDFAEQSVYHENPFDPWKVEDGERNLADFLALVLDTLKTEGDSFVLTLDEEGVWSAERDPEDSLKNTIQTYLC